MEKELLGRLIIESPKGQEKTLELYLDAVITIGRSQDNAVCLPDDTVSQRHAELRADHEGVRFRNHGRNGSIVNSRAVHDSEWIVLSDGAVIRIGGYNLQLELLASELTGSISQTMVMPLDFGQSGDLAQTLFFPMPNSRRENQLVASASQSSGQFDDPAQTMFFQMPTSRNADQSVASVAGRNDLPEKNERAASMFAAKSTEPRRWGLQSGFLKTRIGKVSAGLIVLILALYALMPSQENKAAAPKPEAQIRKEIAREASLPEARPVAAETVVSISADEFERAKLLFQSAEKLFGERMLNQRNLYDGIQKWQESRELLRRFYDAADHNANLAKSRLDKQIDVWKTEVVINYRKKDFKSAHALIQNILAAVPAIEDSSYRWAKDREPRILKELNVVDR